MGLTKEQSAALLSWLRGNALEMASELRDAGWEEDERGLWRFDGKGMGLHLFDAHENATRDATPSDWVSITKIAHKETDMNVERLHCAGGDDDDIGYWALGHHTEEAIRAAVGERYPPEFRHTYAADPSVCTYFMGWWRKVPHYDGARFYRAAAGARGAFRVTALLVPTAEI